MVSGFKIIEDRGAPRLVHLARWQGKRAAQQLVFHVCPVRVEARPEDQSVLLPLLLSRAAGLELAESRGGKGDAGRDEILVQARRRGFPAGCGGYALRGSEVDGQSGAAREGQVRAAEYGREIRQEAARSARRDAEIAKHGRRVWVGADRGDLDQQCFGA